MAVNAKDTKILVDEFDFSGTSFVMSVNIPITTIETSVFQAPGVQVTPNQQQGTINMSGYWDGVGAGKLEEELYARLGTTTPVYVSGVFDTAATIPVAYSLDSTWKQEMSIETPIDGVITLNGTWASGSGLGRGYVLFDGTISATGTQTGVDFAAGGTTGGDAYLHVTAITGSASSATIDVESDTDPGFSSPASEGTFTFSAVGAYKISLTGTVDRYIRINTTSMGGATDFTVVAIAGLNGVTQ